MDFATKVKRNIQEIFYGKGKSLSEIAEAVGKSSSYLSRIAAEHEELPIDISIVRNAMKFTKNYSALETLAWDCGFILVKVPKVSASKGDKNDIIEDYQTAMAEAVSSLIKYFKTPSQNNYKNAIAALNEAIKKSASNKIYVEKDYNGQLEMEI